MKKSKFSIQDRAGGKRLEFIPKRNESLFEKKELTYAQFFKDISGLGNIFIYYKNRKISTRNI